MQCHRTTALDSLFTQLREEPTKIAAMGAGCSVATEATAEVSHYYNITQVIIASELTMCSSFFASAECTCN